MFEELRTAVDRANLRVSLGFSPDDFVILFMGNEFGRKGLKGLLEALAAFGKSTVKLLVVGGGDVRAYGKFAAELGIAGNVRFMGSVPSPENLYLAADAFVLPTLYEPFGIVILEAMAAGVPVITSRLSGATEGMKDRHHALLLERPASVEELVETVGLLRKDETVRQNLIVAGLEKAKEFSWDKIARRVLAVYDDVRREQV
jgi:UDP-glucose:(heptosyl)LPS alpha-1,3-glucosyltransferase